MEENKDQEQTIRRFGQGSLGAMLSEKERKSLLIYIALGVIIVEFVVTIVAILHGLTNMQPTADGVMEYSFPWKAYLISVFLAPVGVMFIIQIIGMGFTRIISGDPEFAEMASDQIPEKVKRWIHLVQGMPTAILLAGLMLVGVVLYHMDTIMGMLVQLGSSVVQFVLWAAIALFAAWLISYVARLWLMYKTRKMQEEYAFRREVLEKTGIAIIDQQTAVTSDGRMLTAGGEVGTKTIEALPVAPNSSSAMNPKPATRSLPVAKPVEE